MRFTMLETIRESALEQLAASNEAEAAQQRFADYYLNLAVAADKGLRGAQMARWLHDLDRAHGNLRTTLDWLVGRDSTALLKMAGALWRYWYRHGHYAEGEQWLHLALAQPLDEPLLRALAQVGAGMFSYTRNNYATATDFYQQALAIFKQYDVVSDQAYVLSLLGILNHDMGKLAEARELHSESLALARTIADEAGIVRALNNLANTVSRSGDKNAAVAYLEEALVLVQAMGNEWGVARTLHNLGAIKLGLGDYTTARSYGQQALTIFQGMGDHFSEAEILLMLGIIEYEVGNFAASFNYCQQSMVISQRLGEQTLLISLLIRIGMAAYASHQLTHATRLIAAGVKVSSVNEDAFGYFKEDEPQQVVIALQGQLDQPELAAAWCEGELMTLDQAVAYALEQQPATGQLEGSANLCVSPCWKRSASLRWNNWLPATKPEPHGSGMPTTTGN